MTKWLVGAAMLLAALTVAAAQRRAAHDEATYGADFFPNVRLITQDGKTVRFYDDLLKDKKVLINFVYSLCDDACPLDTANMVRIQKLLGDRVGRDIFMYSISLDPEHDTPAAMKAYAEQYGAGPGWLFLTGEREDIDAVRFRLGERRNKEAHANVVRAADVAAGRWIRIPLASNPNQIVVEIKNTLDPGWATGQPLKSIADAPRPVVYGPGQVLFQNRCAACHTFGHGDHLGPDLNGVTARRDRQWLIRYLAAPDTVRASQDPIASELAQKYKVLMPNLSLTNKELGDVLQYLEAMNQPHAMH